MEDLLAAGSEVDLLAGFPADTEKAKVAALNKREAAFAAYAAGIDGADRQYRLSSIEEQLLNSGTSVDLENVRTALSDRQDAKRQEEINSVIYSDRSPKEVADYLLSLQNNLPNTTIESMVVDQIQSVDNRFVEPIRGVNTLKKSGGFLYKEEVDQDPVFVEAAKLLHKTLTGKEFGENLNQTARNEIEEQRYKSPAEYGRGVARNMSSVTFGTSQLSKIKTQEEALALLYLMSTVDAQEYTFDGAMKNVWTQLLDPVNALSIGGASVIANTTEKLVARGVLSKAAAKALTLAASSTEGAAIFGTTDYQQQSAEKKAGFREEIDKKELALSAGVGAAFPLAIEGGWLVTKSFLQTIREASPTAGRQLVKDNLSDSAGIPTEAPEETYLKVNPSTNTKIYAGSDVISRYEHYADQASPVVVAMTKEELDAAKPTYLTHLTDYVQSKNRFVRTDKSSVLLDEETGKLYADIAIGPSPDVGYTSMASVSDAWNSLKDEITIEGSIGVLSRQKDGSFVQIDNSELQTVMAAEASGEVTTGEYFLTFSTKDYIEDVPKLAGKWSDDLLQGLHTSIASAFNYGAQRGWRFFTPYSASTNKASFLKQLLEQPISKLKSLPPDGQMSVRKALAESEKQERWMLPSEARAYFNNDEDLVEAYDHFAHLSNDLHSVFDRNLVKDLQTKGFQNISYVDSYGGQNTIIAKVSDSSLLDGAKEAVDLSTGDLVPVSKIRPGVDNGDYKVVQLSSSFVKDKAATNIGIISSKEKIYRSVVTTALNKRGGYIPGVRKAAYRVVRKSDGYTFNGNPIAGSEFLGTAEGQNIFTAAMANSEADARAFIKGLENPSQYDVLTTREAGGVDLSLDAGYQLNNRGLIYGSRAKEPIKPLNGAGELKDVIDSFEYGSNRAANLMSTSRVFKFHEQKWVNTYSKQGKPYPRTKEELEDIIGSVRVGPGSQAGTSLVRQQRKDAYKAWQAIELQRNFQENLIAKAFDSFAIGFDRYISNSKIEKIFPSTGLRWLGKNVAEGRPATQSLKTLSFHTSVATNIAQIPLNMVSAGSQSLMALAAGPKVFTRVMRDFTKALSGKDELLLNQLKSTGMINSVNQHDMQQAVLSMASRERDFKVGITNTAAGKVKQAYGKFTNVVFYKPEQANRAAAFITQRQIYMDETGKAATQLKKVDLDKIVARADVMTATMNNAGKIPITSAPGFDLLMQYMGYPLKMSTLLMSGVPGIGQKVIPAKYVRRSMLAYLGMFGASGIGSGELYDKIRTTYGIDPSAAEFSKDPKQYAIHKMDTFLRNGVFGFTMNSAANLANEVMGDDKDVELAWSKRLSPFGGSGADAFIKPWEFVTQSLLGDGNATENLTNFPAAGLIGSVKDAWDLSAEVIKNEALEEIDDKTFLVAIDLAKNSTSLGRSISKTVVALNTGKLYDRNGKVSIAGLSKVEAMALMIGVNPVELTEMWRVNKATTTGKFASSKNEVEEVAKEHYDRIRKILTLADQNGQSVNETLVQLKAANVLLSLYSSNGLEASKIKKAYEVMINREEGLPLKDRIQDRIDRIVLKSNYSNEKEMNNMIDSIPSSIADESQKKVWKTVIQSAVETATIEQKVNE